MTELVVFRALILIGKHLVCFIYLLELFLGFLIAGVEIRVVFFGKLSVSLLYFIVTRRLRYAEHVIIISFIGCCQDNAPSLFLFIMPGCERL